MDYAHDCLYFLHRDYTVVKHLASLFLGVAYFFTVIIERSDKAYTFNTYPNEY